MIIKKIKDKINFYRQEFSALKRKKSINQQIDISKYNYLQPTCIISKKWYGSVYGGFFVHPERITEQSIIYSFGIGKDITFDTKCIKNHQCQRLFKCIVFNCKSCCKWGSYLSHYSCRRQRHLDICRLEKTSAKFLCRRQCCT